MSHAGKGKEGQVLRSLENTGLKLLCLYWCQSSSFHRHNLFCVLDFKYHFESWPIWVSLVLHPDPSGDSWKPLGWCLDCCNDVFQTQCLAAHFNDRQEVMGLFGTCQVLNVGMKVLMGTGRNRFVLNLAVMSLCQGLPAWWLNNSRFRTFLKYVKAPRNHQWKRKTKIPALQYLLQTQNLGINSLLRVKTFKKHDILTWSNITVFSLPYPFLWCTSQY